MVSTNFVQYEPQEGAAPTERITVYLGYDSHNLYLASDCQDSRPEGIRYTLCQGNPVRGDDKIYDCGWVLTDEDMDLSLMVSGWRQPLIFLN